MAQERKRKKKKSKLILVLLAEVVIVLILFAAIFFYSKYDKLQFDNTDDTSIQTNAEVEIDGYRNIALFGVDSRENALKKGTHSDSIIIASINNKTKEVKLASIYRDTYVNIPGEGYNKINSAYFKGGYSLALSTINTNFDLDVNEFVTVNFDAIVKIIDKLGGITLDITDSELKYLNGYVRELNRINGTKVEGLKTSGTQHVNGTQATAYARIRYTKGGDYKRAERQRIVVAKMLEKIKQSDLSTLNSIIDEMLPQVYTNLTATDILSLAKSVLSYNIVDNTGFPFEPDAHTYNKVSYVFPIDLAANVIQLHKFLFDEEDYRPSATVQEYSTYIEEIRTK